MLKTLVLLSSVLVCILGSRVAAEAAQATAPPPPLATPSPVYQTIVLSIDVNKPAPVVWAKVGKYCHIAVWLGVTCVITSGVEGELGSVRTINGTVVEPLIGKTDLSYTYTQPVRVGVPYNLYHGMLEAKAVTPAQSKLIYSWVYDVSPLDQLARAQDRAARTERFNAALQKMKAIAETE